MTKEIKIKNIIIIKPNGSSVSIKSPLRKHIYRHNVPFFIKPAWRDRSKKSGVVYSNFKELLGYAK